IYAVYNLYINNLAKILEDNHEIIRSTNINTEILIPYFNRRDSTKMKWNSIINNIFNNEETRDINIKQIKTILTPHRDYMNELKIDLLKGKMMLIKPYGIMKKIKNTNQSFMSLYNPHPATIMQINSYKNTFL